MLMCICIQVLETVKVEKEMDRETLIDVARTSLCTKVSKQVANVLTEVGLLIVITVTF